jgi:signal transduction histidine kinase
VNWPQRLAFNLAAKEGPAMGRLHRTFLNRFGIALLTFILALLLIRLSFFLGWESTWLRSAAILLFLAAVLVTSWAGGIGPGQLATVFLALVLAIFVLPPVRFEVLQLADGMQLALFVAIVAPISLLGGVHRRQIDHRHQQDRRKDELLAILAHELCTPLAVATNALHLLRFADPDSAARNVRGILERQGAQMTRLIDDLLEMSRFAQGKVRLCKEPVDLATIVTQAVESLAPLMEVLRHRLEVVLPAEPIRLLADQTRVVQILVNLLTNAARYTDPGGLIRLEAERCVGYIWLRVRDSGIGLAPETLPHVFELFSQAEDGSRGGLGIGLSVVRDLAELHGGGAVARSAGLGKGSEFAVWLPLGSLSTPSGDAVRAVTLSYSANGSNLLG